MIILNIDFCFSCRYKEVCPYPDLTFTQVTKNLDIPETLLTDFTSGSTYHIQVGHTIHDSKFYFHCAVLDRNFLWSAHTV